MSNDFGASQEPQNFDGLPPQNEAGASTSSRSSYNDDVQSFDGQNLHKTMTSAQESVAHESEVETQRQLSRILTNTKERETVTDYSQLPPMGAGRPFPPSLPEKSDYEVTFNGPDDPMHPFNWPLRKKILVCLILGAETIGIAMGSSIFAAAVPQICKIYDVIPVVAILGITLYVFGFAVGPVIWGPLSENFGRQGVLVVSALGFSLFQFAVATAENLQTIMICRFFAGAVGAAPMAVVPAAFADMFDNTQRGTTIVIFSMGVMLAPILAPIFSSYIVQYTSWRWTQYVIAIYGAVNFVLIVIFYEESHHQIILVNKAKALRKATGNWGIHAAHEDVELSFSDIAKKTITRPIYMLFTEPIILLVTIYNSFIYGLLYLLLEAYPIVFVQRYHFFKNGELPYLALIVGMIFNAAMNVWFEREYVKKVMANGGKPCPEERLKPLVIAGIVFPIGILWFCWTGNYNEKVHYMVPTVAGGFIGFGLIGIFMPCFNYIIDSYLFLAASAIAGNTFMRSAFGGAFPLFAGYMFKGMGVNWAGLLIGLCALAMVPVPLLFMKYGKRLRQKSKFAFDL